MAPARALDEIEASPEWLPAYVVMLALALAGAYLELPAILHVLGVVKLPSDAPVPKPYEVTANVLLSAAFLPLMRILMVAISCTLFVGVRDVSRLFGGTFGRFVSLASACGVIFNLGQFVQGIGVRLYDPAHFADWRSIEAAVPITLGFFASPGNDRQLSFLSYFGIFEIWANIVMSYGLARFAGVSLTVALAFVFALDLGLAMFLT